MEKRFTKYLKKVVKLKSCHKSIRNRTTKLMPVTSVPGNRLSLTSDGSTKKTTADEEIYQNSLTVNTKKTLPTYPYS